MTARTYIKNNIDSKYSNKLLKGLDTYLRRIKQVHFHEYTAEDLAQELHELKKRKGIGPGTINVLRTQLQTDGYLSPHNTGLSSVIHTTWERVKSLFKGSI